MKQFRFTLAFIGVLLAASLAHAQTNEHCIKAATSGNLNCLSAPDSSAAVNQQLPGTASALNQTPVGTGSGTYTWQSASTAAASLSTPYVACSPTLTPLTGTSTPTIIAQCEILANIIPVGGSVDIVQLTGITGNTDTKTLQCYWGTAGTSSDPALNDGTTTSTAANVYIQTFVHIVTNGTTSANLSMALTQPGSRYRGQLALTH